MTRSPAGALLALLAACGGGEERTLRSAVLITLDTTNAQALDMYGRDRGVTPNLAALAAESVVFDRAWTVVPMTLPTHASILTGLYPPRHGVRDNGHLPLPSSARTVGELAQEAGAATAAFVAAVVIAAPYGLGQGFDLYDEPLDDRSSLERGGAKVTAAAIGWLALRAPGRPFFLWAHYFEPHAPYDPTPEDERAAGGPYLGEVRAMDRQVGRLLERLGQESDYDEMTIVVVADHGEAHGRHGEPTHSILVYENTMRVPLLVRHPGRVRGGERDGRLASVVDVFPTLLEGMGLPPIRTDGRSLLAAPAAREGVYIESYCGYLNFGFSPLAGWVGADFKYVHGTSPELYDLAGDPLEARNLFAPGDLRVVAARAGIARVAASGVLERAPDDVVRPGDRVDVTALGYAGASSESAPIPAPLEDTGRPDPREHMGEVVRVIDAVFLAESAGRPSVAIDQLRAVVQGNPGNNMAQQVLGHLLVENERYAEAIAPLQKLLEDGHERANVLVPLAEAYAAQGDVERARLLLRRAHEIVPGDERAQRALDQLPGD